LSTWTNEYLIQHAGESEVEVEKRTSVKSNFGQGDVVKMKFKDVVQKLDNGDESLYLTTQTIRCNRNGQPNIISEPLTHLTSDFPIRPKLFGNLLPMNLNLWMGNAKNGSSTGLHHDYHDNLYVLLRGSKQFRLYSPADTSKMYTQGQVVKVHPNGRINYIGFETQADGSETGSLESLQLELRKLKAEKELQAAELAVANKELGSAVKLSNAEKEMEAVMDLLISDEVDDYYDDSAESDDNEPMKKKLKCNDPTIVPLNFSRVSNFENPGKEFPEFSRAVGEIVTLHAGEMLYLPAGWFHEVTSKNSDGSHGHMAFNYWMHPGDSSEFNTPYKSEFWKLENQLRETQ